MVSTPGGTKKTKAISLRQGFNLTPKISIFLRAFHISSRRYIDSLGVQVDFISQVSISYERSRNMEK